MDSYKTFEAATEEILFKEKNSKFFGYGFPLKTVEELKTNIENLRKQHFGAGHFCYAYQIGTTNIEYRTNDDGEPKNSAGIPIFGQIQSRELTNVLIVIIRYFGGTKLGVGGLISAYKTAAQLVIENAVIIEKTIHINYIIKFDYKNLNIVMRIIKERKIIIIAQKMELQCEIEIAIPNKISREVFNLFNSLFEIKIDYKK